MKRAIALTAALSASLALAPAPAHAATSTRVSLPYLWPSSGLSDVEVDSASDVWITGHQGAWCVRWPAEMGCRASSAGNPVIRRWTGSSWREYPLRGWDSAGEIGSITTSGAEVWALGGAYLARFDGSAFQRVQAPAANLAFVHTGPAGTWTGSGDALYRWSGDGWTRTPVPGGFAAVKGVTSTGANEAFAVGRRTTGRVVLARWDGTAWTDLGVEDADFSASDIVAAGPGEAWVLGHFGVGHLKNGTWTVIPFPAGTSQGLSIGVDGTGAPVASVGSAGTGGFGVLYRYSAGSWQQLTDTGVVANVRASSHVPGTTTLWAVGVHNADTAVAYTVAP